MFDASRTGYSVPRSLPGVATNGSPSRSSGPRLSPPSKDDGSSSHRLQLFYRDPFRHRPLPRRRRTASGFGSSSHGVLRPSSERAPVDRHVAGVPPPTPTLHGLSQTLEGFPHRHLRVCFAPLPLMGFRPSRAFPSHRTLLGSSPSDTLSTFPHRLRRTSSRVPRALCPTRVRCRSGSIASLVGPMLSWASPLPRHPTARAGDANE
jgi:hypothetical protein